MAASPCYLFCTSVKKHIIAQWDEEGIWPDWKLIIFLCCTHFNLGKISVAFPYSWVKFRPGKRELLRTHRQKRRRFEPSFQPHPVLWSQPPDFQPSMLALVQHVARTIWIKNLDADTYVGVFSHHISNSNTSMGKPSSVRPVPANVHLHIASVHLLFVW